MKLLLSLLLLLPVFLYAEIIHVNLDGSGDYTSIQEGINNANPGDTVLVFPGNYIETIDFLGKDIVVGSLFLTTQNTDYIESTVIDGNGENYQLVKFTNGETANARLVGFTITHAETREKQQIDDIGLGLGIHIKGSSPSVEYNRIVDNVFNSWYFNGGGISIENSSAQIIGNTISNNDMACMGGGIFISNASHVIIKENTISDHEINPGYGYSYGAGIYIYTSDTILIENNHIHDNHKWSLGYGGGVYMLGCNAVSIIRNIFERNSSTVGGGIYAAGSEVIINGNLLVENEADYLGGGIYFGHCDALVVNNTLSENRARVDKSAYGGGVACSNSSPEFYNNIIYGNTATAAGNQVYLASNADPNFFYNNIEGGMDAFGLLDTVTYDGIYAHNIQSDPHYLFSGDHPYALNFNSPCINAGSPDTTGLMIPPFDLAGFNRIVQETIDMGAYENQSHVSIPAITTNEKVKVFPNPTEGKITLFTPNLPLDKAKVFVEDLRGNLMWQTRITQRETIIDLSMLTAGVYLLRTQLSGNELVNKIVIY
ncbi:MAG: hypothetical protein CSA95_00390 [Bacteroidetes bacterium]|nr:MAG: hypothetical protein CSA95_00390 [Bacteroidota bacterium]